MTGWCAVQACYSIELCRACLFRCGCTLHVLPCLTCLLVLFVLCFLCILACLECGTVLPVSKRFTTLKVLCSVRQIKAFQEHPITSPWLELKSKSWNAILGADSYQLHESGEYLLQRQTPISAICAHTYTKHSTFLAYLPACQRVSSMRMLTSTV